MHSLRDVLKQAACRLFSVPALLVRYLRAEYAEALRADYAGVGAVAGPLAFFDFSRSGSPAGAPGGVLSGPVVAAATGVSSPGSLNSASNSSASSDSCAMSFCTT